MQKQPWVKNKFMKRFLCTVIAALAISALPAQDRPATERQAVQQTVINFFDALAKRDTVALRFYCVPEILLFENGGVWNLDTLVQGIRQNQATDFKRINSIEFIHTEIKKDIAWTTYNNQADITRNGKQRTVKWVETVILLKEKKNWKIKLLHSTPAKTN